MLCDIDDVSVRVPDEESTNSPRLVGNRVHDLIAVLLRILIGSVDVIDFDGHDGVFWRRRVSSHDLDGRA
jgi:hypothetical protein